VCRERQFLRLYRHTRIMGRQLQRRGTVGENQHCQRSSCSEDCFENSQNYCSTSELKQNWIFILKTLFLLSDLNFTKPTSTVELQLLNLWLPKVMLRCVNDGVTTIKPEHLTTGNARHMVRLAVLHTVRYIRKSLRLENCQWGLQSWMPGSNSEARGRSCNGFGINNVVQYFWSHYYPSWSNCCTGVVDRLGNQVCLMIQTLFPNNDAVFQDENARPFTPLKLFSHDLKSMKVNLNHNFV
jgi:hypothetical protein